VISSVTGCSTCSRVFISMNQMRSGRRPSDASAMNSTVPAPDIADRLRRAHRRAAHRRAGRRVHAGRGRLLDHLLVAALQRAVALEQMDDIAVAVAEHLHLDVARRSMYFSISTRSSPNAGRGLALAARQRVLELLGRVDRRMPLPPPPATALISTG
jgi:hypothetical protein